MVKSMSEPTEKLHFNKPNVKKLKASLSDPKEIEKQKRLCEALDDMVKNSKRISVELMWKPFDI